MLAGVTIRAGMFAFPGVPIRNKDLALDAVYRFKCHGPPFYEILGPGRRSRVMPAIRFNFLPGRAAAIAEPFKDHLGRVKG